MQWYQYQPTLYYGTNGERGIDLGTPNNTPLSIPLGGKVLKADYYGGGGEVVVQTANNLIEYFFHLNDIFVKAGQQLAAGSIVGSSGGGVGDKHLSPSGGVETVTNQSQLEPYSSGYHTEFGLLRGSTINDFNTAMNTGSNSIDPLSFIQNLQTKGLTAVPIPNAPSGGSVYATTGFDPQQQITNWFSQQYAKTFASIVHQAITIIGFVLVGLMLAIFGLSLLTGSTAIPISPSGGAVLHKLGGVIKK